MSVLYKTVQTPPLALQEVGQNSFVKSSVIDVSSIFSGAVYWDFVPAETSVAPAATNLVMETSQTATGNLGWVPMWVWASNDTNEAPVVVSPVTGSTFTSTTDLGLNVWIFFYASPVSNGEFHYIVKREANTPIAGTYTYTTEDPPTNAVFGGGSNSVNTLAQRFRFDVDLSAVLRIRFAVFNNQAAVTRKIVTRVAFTTLDSIV